jgi:hypothetical protein
LAGICGPFTRFEPGIAIRFEAGICQPKPSGRDFFGVATARAALTEIGSRGKFDVADDHLVVLFLAARRAAFSWRFNRRICSRSDLRWLLRSGWRGIRQTCMVARLEHSGTLGTNGHDRTASALAGIPHGRIDGFLGRWLGIEICNDGTAARYNGRGIVIRHGQPSAAAGA